MDNRIATVAADGDIAVRRVDRAPARPIAVAGHVNIAVDDVQDDIATDRVPGPFTPVLFLTPNVPTFHVHLALFEDFDVQADGRDGFDRLAVR